MNIYQVGKMTVRLLQTEDEQLLVQWLSDPEVLRYYEGRDQPHDLELVRAHFYNQDDEVTRCIVLYDGRSIGYIQFYELETEERAEYGYADNGEIIYGTDQFIGGNGLLEHRHWLTTGEVYDSVFDSGEASPESRYGPASME